MTAIRLHCRDHRRKQTVDFARSVAAFTDQTSSTRRAIGQTSRLRELRKPLQFAVCVRILPGDGASSPCRQSGKA
jgi:hypothetical protein